jgi:hypothetical protein
MGSECVTATDVCTVTWRCQFIVSVPLDLQLLAKLPLQLLPDQLQRQVCHNKLMIYGPECSKWFAEVRLHSGAYGSEQANGRTGLRRVSNSLRNVRQHPDVILDGTRVRLKTKHGSNVTK